MSHTYIANWLHIIWLTKDRARYFSGDSAIKLREHLISESTRLKSPVEAINIQPESVHILVNLPSTLALEDFVHRLKGESAHWVNENRMICTVNLLPNQLWLV